MEYISFLESITLLSVVKVLLITFLIVYNVFAILIVKQIAAMSKAVKMGDDFLIRLAGISHFVFAALVLFLAIVIL